MSDAALPDPKRSWFLSPRNQSLTYRLLLFMSYLYYRGKEREGESEQREALGARK